MSRHKILYSKSRKAIVIVILGLVISSSSKTLQNQESSAEMNKLISISAELQKLENDPSNISYDEDEYYNSTNVPESQFDSEETFTEKNLQTSQNKLNDSAIYEHVTDKNNVSARSFVYISPSKFRIPFLNPLARPYSEKKKDDVYHSPFNTNADVIEGVSGGNFGPLYAGYSDPNSYKSEFSSDNRFYTADNRNNLKSEMDSLTNQVKTANGIINKQYQNLNNDLNILRKQFPVKIAPQAYPNDQYFKMFKNVLPNRKSYNVQDKFDSKNTSTNSKDINGTANNHVNPVQPGDRYDFVELIKPPLLRSGLFKHNQVNLPNNYPLGSNEPRSFNNDILGTHVNKPLETQPFGFKPLGFDSSNPNGNVYGNQQMLEIKQPRRGGPNPNEKLFNSLYSDLFDTTPYRQASLSGSLFNDFKPNLFASNPDGIVHDLKWKDKPFLDLHSHTYIPNMYEHGSRSPSKSLDLKKPDLIQMRSLQHNNLSLKNNTANNLEQNIEPKTHKHENRSLMSETYSKFKSKPIDMMPFPDDHFLKKTEHTDNTKQNPNLNIQKYKSSFTPYQMNKNVMGQKLTPGNIHGKSHPPIKPLEFISEDNNDSELFQDSLISKKLQEMKELSRQFEDESISKESNKKRNERRPFTPDHTNIKMYPKNAIFTRTEK